MKPLTSIPTNRNVAGFGRACGLALLMLSPAAWAGGTVTDLTDADLRAAMAGGGLVTFAVDGTITLTSTLNNAGDTIIDATGHSISLCYDSLLLYVPTNTSLTLIGLTLENCYSSDVAGGGILNDGGTLGLVGVTLRNFSICRRCMGSGVLQGAALVNKGGHVSATNCLFSQNAVYAGMSAQGGAVANILGWFTAQDCTFAGNTAQGVPSDNPPTWNGPSGYGGAIYNTGTLALRNCTLSGNHASGGIECPGPGQQIPSCNAPGGAGGSGLGSAIFSSGSACLVNCTITGNQATGSNGWGTGSGAGGSAWGAVCATNGLAMTNCTVAFNSAYAGSGGSAAAGLIAPSAVLVNCIVANNSPAGDSIGTDLGHNLSSESAFHAPSSLNYTDPKLGSLAQNGGPTATLALLAGSPAIDAADTASAPATDQRGFARAYGAAADIGAYEYGAPAPPQPFSLTWANNNGAIMITGYTGTPTAITIPGTINGLPVTSIADRAFQYCTTLATITIGDSVTEIGALAFQYCSGLTNVAIGKGVTTLGTFAFIGCNNLTSVYFQGNAPTDGGGVLELDDNATVYIQPGTTGWGSSFGGRPTALSALPRLLTPPQTQTAEVGSSVRFWARADGNPAVAFQWLFNGTSRVGSTNRVLQLTNVQPSNAGAYTVVVTNAYASVTSPPAWLSVIAPVPRRLIPALPLTGPTGTSLKLDCRNALDSSAAWTNFDSVSLTSTSQWYFDMRTPLSPQRFYRSWTTDPLNQPSPLDLHMVPAITLSGIPGGSIRVDAINQIGPTNAWWNLDTIILTNPWQLYFDTSTIGQPPRLWRLTTLNVVTSLADSGNGSLRQVLAGALPGSTIIFNVTGTIDVSSMLTLDKDISILGPGASVLTISGNGSTRIFGVNSGVRASISGLTLRNGKAPNGADGVISLPETAGGAGEPGGVITNAGSLTLWNCALLNNAAGNGGRGVNGNMPGSSPYPTGGGPGGDGGAIYNLGTLSISNCVFTGNTSGSGGDSGMGSDYNPPAGAGGCGGAIFNTGVLQVDDSVFSGNSTGSGGRTQFAIYGVDGGWGGAVYSLGNMSASRSSFIGNSTGAGGNGGGHTEGQGWPGGAGGHGGAICGLGALSLVNCTVNSNVCGAGGDGGPGLCCPIPFGPGAPGSGGCGGGIYAKSNLTLVGSTISSNRAGIGGGSGWGAQGGGIYAAGILGLTNCTITANSCTNAVGGSGGSGGGIYCAYTATNILFASCTVAGNDAGFNGSAAGIYVSRQVLGGFVNNIIAWGVGRTQDVIGVFNSLGHNLIGATTGSTGFTAVGDLVGSAEAPLDPLLGPLADNGGPTLTMALLPGSPAIDAGATLGAPATDQRGFVRPYGGAVDIGAYEYGASQP